jgi:hypothetical protein
MTKDEALQVCQTAIEDARKRVGVEQKILQQELERMMEADPELFAAFALVGISKLSGSQQETKH